MICPAKLDFIIPLGGSFIESLQWWNLDANEPHDLTNCRLKMVIRHKVDSEDFLVELSTDNGRIIIDNPTSGLFTLYMTHIDTLRLRELKVRSSVYDLLVIKGDFHYYPLTGRITYRSVTTYTDDSVYKGVCSTNNFINGGYRL